ncbi:MAG TPA: anhydro-N-acetylmuramic acid kinase [Puia sp.]|nr:anhydro-N-acetylmuramic acid kinase [Puia sp.]
MVYKVIGLMSGSSLDGLDIAYVHLQENAGKWEFSFVNTGCYPYTAEWKERLYTATGLYAVEYQLLHTDFGRYLGEQVNRFITEHELAYTVQLIASHGHTSFHIPERKMTAQLGEGAALAAVTGINVVSDLRAMDVALGGQGAPIVPVGEKGLLTGYRLFLNLGGIANISAHTASGSSVAFDVCPANRVLDLLAAGEGLAYDKGGSLAATGKVEKELLGRINALPYYSQAYPKSLANGFGTDVVFPMVQDAGLSTADALRTYAEHIAQQISEAVGSVTHGQGAGQMMLVTGGGAYNSFLVGRLQELLGPLQVELVVPEKELIEYKEALIMAFMGVLRWREKNNVLASVTGASRDSIGGAIWIGQEA